MKNSEPFDLPPGPIPAENRIKDAYLMKEDINGEGISVSIRKAEIVDVRNILELVKGSPVKPDALPGPTVSV